MSELSKPPRYWRPLVEAPLDTFDLPDAVVKETMDYYKIDREAATKMLNDEHIKCKYWINDLYQVEVREIDPEAKLFQFNIRRRDGAPIHDWRHLQQIKNELAGPECEAIELYPAESRKVDTSNKMHLWAILDPTFRFPVGFQKRDVQDDLGYKVPGLRQRKL